MQLVATDVQGLVLPGTGHWVAEESADDLLAALADFLARYRAGADTQTLARVWSLIGRRS